jgi:hypothetical protein
LPSPGTALVRPLQRLHFEQVETSTATSRNVSSEDITLYPFSFTSLKFQCPQAGRGRTLAPAALWGEHYVHQTLRSQVEMYQGD